ncbi:hypothetical protein OG552_11105 [Streptomyces sp. NBC_01476]|nr:hypothetical protein [Streptomyces sp. NBC_01476]
MEWINPKYADILAAMKRTDAERSEDQPEGDHPPVRGFLLPAPSEPS